MVHNEAARLTSEVEGKRDDDSTERLGGQIRGLHNEAHLGLQQQLTLVRLEVTKEEATLVDLLERLSNTMHDEDEETCLMKGSQPRLYHIGTLLVAYQPTMLPRR